MMDELTMREIKFRGWSIFDEKWVYGYLTVRFNIRSDEKHYFIYSETGMSGWRVDPESVGQYTGLMDYKRQDIYEGDLIKVESYYFGDALQKEFIGVCIYIDGAYHIESHYSQTDKSYYNFDENETVQVVGNLYENKELLNE